MRFIQIAGVVLIILITVFMLIGIAIPEFDYRNRVTVNKPQAEVFAAFNDTGRTAQWMDGLQRIEHTGGAQEGTGSRWRMTIVQNGETMTVDEEVTLFSPDSLLMMRMGNEVLDSYLTIEFIQKDSAVTDIHQHTRVVGANPLWQSVLPLFKGTMRDANQANLERFRAMLEGG